MYPSRPASRFAGSLRTSSRIPRCIAPRSCIMSPVAKSPGRALQRAAYSVSSSLSSSSVKETCPYPSNGRPKRVAVIGGGITGLTAAFRLSQDPSTNVTLFEKSSRLGGWLQSTYHDLDFDVCDEDDGRIHHVGGPRLLYEYGPRTFRGGCPGVLASLELLMDLGIDLEVIKTGDPIDRYIYYPDHLVRLPGAIRNAGSLKSAIANVSNILQEPVLYDAAWSLVYEPMQPFRSRNIEDESIGDFLARRFGKETTDNIASAAFHGVYAGDIYKLSAKALLYPTWQAELNEKGIVRESLQQANQGQIFLSHDMKQHLDALKAHRDSQWVSGLMQVADFTSMFAPRHGMQSIAETIESRLATAENADVELNSSIKNITRPNSASKNITIELEDGTSTEFDYVLSTTSPPQLSQHLSALEHGSRISNFDAQAIRNLLSSLDKSVDVMIVNLFYEDVSLVPDGFGYLIPRSLAPEQNPERALGVIFSSNLDLNQDELHNLDGTKLTVMMGGHYWRNKRDSLPDEETAIDMAQDLLRRHLNITDTEPVHADARLQRSCIPQYEVGHVSRMDSLDPLLRDIFDGSLKVAGAWYTGVSLNDCIRNGHLAALSILSGNKEETGLQKYVGSNAEGSWWTLERTRNKPAV